MKRKKRKQQSFERGGYRISGFYIKQGVYCCHYRKTGEAPEIYYDRAGRKRYKYRTKYWRSSTDNLAMAHKQFDLWFEANVLNSTSNEHLTPEALFQKWLSSPELEVREPTYKDYKKTLLNRILPAFQAQKIQQIKEVTPDTICEVIKTLSASKTGTPTSGRTKTKFLALIKRVFSWAEGKNYIEKTPVKFQAPKAWGKEIRRSRHRGLALTNEQAKQLLEACRQPIKKPVVCKKGRRKGVTWVQESKPPDYLFLLVLIGLHVGLRRKNLLGLQWRHLKQGCTVLDIPGPEMKNGERLHVPLHPEVTFHLRKTLKEHSGEKISKKDDYVIRIPSTHRTAGSEIKNSFRSATRRAGVEFLTDSIGREQSLRIHDLRHTCATRLADRVPQTIKDRILGHTPVSMGARYTHVALENLRKNINKLPWFFLEEKEKKKFENEA